LVRVEGKGKAFRAAFFFFFSHFFLLSTLENIDRIGNHRPLLLSIFPTHSLFFSPFRPFKDNVQRVLDALEGELTGEK